MKKILCFFFLTGGGLSSAYALCSTYKTQTECDTFGKPMCRWNEVGQCVAGDQQDAPQSTIERHPLTVDLGDEKKESNSNELPPPE